MRINTNVGALNASRNIFVNNMATENSMRKVSSGLRISRAADDAAGLSIALGGGLRDSVGSYALHGGFGPIFATPAFGYASVYLIDIVVLFATLIALAPLVRTLLVHGDVDPQTIVRTAEAAFGAEGQTTGVEGEDGQAEWLKTAKL